MTHSHDSTRGSAYVADRFDRWGSRFRAKGLDSSGIDRLKQDIDAWPDWCRAFSAVGEEHADRGRDALEHGNEITASEHLLRAAMYYHFGSFAWFFDEDERERAHRRAVALFRQAGAYFDPPIERIEAPAPDGDYVIPGNLRVPDRNPNGLDESPLVVLLSGLDSTKEEQHTRASDFHRRGVATLTVDGAGQGEVWYHQRMTPAYPRFVSAIVDRVQSEQVSGLDATRLGIYGVSLGGFYAPQVAATDDRFDACVGLSGPFTVGPVTSHQSESLIEGFEHACKTDSLVDVDRITERMHLRDRIEDLQAPALLIAGANDHVIPPAQTERIAHEAPNGELLYYEDGDHVCKNKAHDYRPRAADWLRDRLVAAGGE
ncbi:alpha/beta hydrolase family protein [Halorientalis brevis]|uniref:Alpha/beta hydrolase family protein n=1 Tax=Halorientalis brevis TaxID=1126241 RepID=A0ABD6CIK2_9EURY|nr:alpha/beta hydrolase [Halorientalis brevis]